MRTVFLEKFGYLSDCLNHYKHLESALAILDITNQLIDPTYYWPLNIVNIEIEEFDIISNIIDLIVTGDRVSLQNIKYIKNYFKNILNKFECEHNNRRSWRYKCPEMYSDVYEIEEDIMYTVEDLLSLMNMSPFELFQMMTISEKISLQNVCQELNIPYDIERYVTGFIGF